MLTVLTNIVRPHHERQGSGSNNKPELRQKLIIEKIQKKFSECQIIFSSKTIDESWLGNIHDRDYIDFLKNAFSEWRRVDDPDWVDETGGIVPDSFYKKKPRPEIEIPLYKLSGYFGSDRMTPIYEDTYKNATIAAQQALRAADIINQDQSKTIVYVLACSPGHHTKYSEYGGYCFINNAFVSAFRLIELGKKKIGILDLDYHGGTADLILSNPNFKDRVSFVSIHVDPQVDYPSFEGFEEENTSTILNIPLSPHAGWELYEEALENGCKFLEKSEIEVLIIPFGADTYKNDPDASPLGRFQLDLEDYEKMGQLIHKYFAETSIIITQEGGYDMEAVPDIVCRFLKYLSTENNR